MTFFVINSAGDDDNKTTELKCNKMSVGVNRGKCRAYVEACMASATINHRQQ